VGKIVDDGRVVLWRPIAPPAAAPCAHLVDFTEERG
jgi:hypothetical protein